MFSPVLSLALAAVSVSAVPNRLWSASPSASANQVVIATTSNQDGAPAIIHSPFFEDDDKHTIDVQLPYKGQNAGPQQLSFFNGQKCLDVKDGDRSPGAKLQLWTCDQLNGNQQWIAQTDLTYRWNGTDLCIDVTDGNFNDGNQLQVWTCDASNGNQQFSSGPQNHDPAVFYTPAGSYFTASSVTDGASIALAPKGVFTDAFPEGTQSWLLPAFDNGVTSGAFKTVSGNKCLDLPDGNTSNGNTVQLWTCYDGSVNQQWTYTTESKNIKFGNSDKCLEVEGDKIQIADCDGSDKQKIFRNYYQ